MLGSCYDIDHCIAGEFPTGAESHVMSLDGWPRGADRCLFGIYT
jgi:hypothetical protein